jgi:hypothetical protein
MHTRHKQTPSAGCATAPKRIGGLIDYTVVCVVCEFFFYK